MNTSGVYTLIKKELSRTRKIWKQTILAPAVSNLLFLIVFGVAISSRASAFAEYEYLTVLVPGLVAMGLITNALQNPLSSLIIAKYTNNIGDLLMLPLTGFELAISYLTGGLVRGAIVGIVTLLVGMFFAPIPFANPLLILIFTILIGGIFASIGAIIGVVTGDFDKANVIPTFVITPLVYLGGVFYSIQTLPATFQVISKFNPIFYMVDGFRYGFLGVSDVSIYLSLLVTTTIFVISISIVSWIFHSGYKLKT